MKNKLLIFILLIAHCVYAQNDSILRPVLSAYTVEVGTAHRADTYLTPLHYSGQHYGLSYERMQAMRFNPENWVMQLDGRLTVDRTLNPARNATMWSGKLQLAWGMMRCWRFEVQGSRFKAGVGPGVTLDAGAVWLRRNSNNPVSAIGSLTADLRGLAAYRIKIGKLPVTFRYEAALPVTGAFFSPQYGQLYYEIWLGEHKNLAHAAWWGNYFSLRNLVTADLRFGGTSLRLGYRNEILSTKVNGIVTRCVTHSAVFGIATEWLSLSPKRRSLSSAKIISALYPNE